jgi:hypothetical protein
MKTKEQIETFMTAILDDTTSSLLTRLLTLSPDSYRLCVDSLIDGVMSIDDLNSIPVLNDASFAQFMENRLLDLSFYVYDGSENSGAGVADFCNNILNLGAVYLSSTNAANQFKYTNWNAYSLKTNIGPNRANVYYDNVEQLIEDFDTMVVPGFPTNTVKAFLPLQLTNELLDNDNFPTDVEVRDFAKKLYSEIFTGRGIIEAIHNDEAWKIIIGYDYKKSLILNNPLFIEELFNAYYPFNNTLGICKSIRSDVSSAGIENWSPDYLLSNVIGRSYTKFIRNKLTYAITVSMIVTSYQSAEGSTALKESLGSVIVYMIDKLDVLRDYIKGISILSKKSMKVG